ncbi:response regulator transcription factor [Lachnospiraceae bacterium OttesenSCG-928-D06]|nr:response regulator transcription factor [Lachnospiraceae bacterium OttesenSCG-928-D06]
MSKKFKILLVEDEIDVQQANRHYLIEQGYDVFCTETLQGAREILQENSLDLLLLDVLLPDGSGFDLCKEVRSYSTMPIIFLTAIGGDGDVVGGLSLGGDDYIVKPYSMDILGARISAHLRRYRGSSGIIELPPLRIDLVAGSVWLDNVPLQMTPTQIKLLVYLVEHRGHVLSQSQIYQEIWGADTETMGNIVRMNISRLRKKLSIDSDASYFDITSTHQGYRFLRIKYPEAK